MSGVDLNNNALQPIPADFDWGSLPRGYAGWRCRHCGWGRIFYGTTAQEGQEVKVHEAACPVRPAGVSGVGAVDAAAAFNAAHPVGAVVRYWTGAREGDGKIGYTWHRAEGGANFGRPIVYIRERGTDMNVGAVALTHVQALTAEEMEVLPQADPLAPAEVEVTMTASWRVTVDPRSREWEWLKDYPRADWERAIREDHLEVEPTAYEAFCAEAGGPYGGPDYAVEVNP